jgi:HEPN domain-containing protein/predicted nucleotidyltransferase
VRTRKLVNGGAVTSRAPVARGPVTAEPDAIRQAVAELREAANPRRIILFGSYARGEQTADSDVDVMVIEAHLADAPRESERLRRLMSPFEPPIQVLTTDKATFEYWRDTPGNVYYEADHGGRDLFRAEGETDRGRQPVVRSREQAANLLHLAGDDVALLETVLESGRVSDAIFGFHAQQAAEKLLKAVFAAYRTRVGKQHNIKVLMEQLKTLQLSLPDGFSNLADLTEFAVTDRYIVSDTMLDRGKLLGQILALRQWAEGRIATAPESDPTGA